MQDISARSSRSIRNAKWLAICAALEQPEQAYTSSSAGSLTVPTRQRKDMFHPTSPSHRSPAAAATAAVAGRGLRGLDLVGAQDAHQRAGRQYRVDLQRTVGKSHRGGGIVLVDRLTGAFENVLAHGLTAG
jgi:hypothetical protein